MSYWAAKFEKFHKENPHVYELFNWFTLELIRAGVKHSGSEMVLGRIRWETTINTTGDRFKINQNYAAYYARKFMEDFPEYAGFFRTRKTRS